MSETEDALLSRLRAIVGQRGVVESEDESPGGPCLVHWRFEVLGYWAGRTRIEALKRALADAERVQSVLR